MAGLGKLMNFLKLTDEDDEFEDDYYNDDYAYDQRELEKEEKRLLKEQRREEKRAAFRDKQEREEYFDEPAAPAPAASTASASATKRGSTYRAVSGSKVVQMPTPSGEVEDIRIVRPSNIEEAQQVCTLLMETHPVVVNLEGIDVQEAQRIMDFVSGCVYAVSGNMCQVSRYIFVFAPKDIDIYGDYLKSLENEEIYNIASFSNKEF